jgi:hypothetical protein
MKAKEYNVMQMAVSAGVEYGYNRAHKHTDSPSEDQIKEAIIKAVMDEICEWFVFEEVYKEYK